jgi:cell division protein FtsW
LKSHQPDYYLLTFFVSLVAVGLIALASASMVKSQEMFGQPYYFLKRQLLFCLAAGVPLAFLGYAVNYKFWKKISVLAYAATVAFLFLIFLPGLGVVSGGAMRWLNLGPIDFQPSEFAKLSLIIYLAAWLEPKIGQRFGAKAVFIPFLILIGIVIGLIVLQPNIGTAGLIALIAVAMYFAAGAPTWQVGSLCAAGIAFFVAFIKIFPHAANRFLIFLHPELDPKGIGYQINQALLAIGSGGFFGRGLGQSIQKFNYLPEVIGDSVFAVVAEEVGFVGVVVILALFAGLAWRGYFVAKKAPDSLSRLLAFGITSWIVFQAFINIAAISGLIPLTGVPLPFISYGSSGLLSAMLGMGILLNISKYATK